MEAPIDTPFPVLGLLPKKETGVTNFLTKYPSFDGRGVLIAIFDSGVDPSADGLKVTTDGKVKVVERYDCSGAGDVDTSTIANLTDGENRTAIGITGRELKFPSHWENPTGKYHLGAKNAFELYPSKLIERIKKLRKEKLWDPKHKEAVAAASRKLELEDGATNDNNLSGLDKLRKEEKEVELDQLAAFEKKYDDRGPTYDCVLFHNGTNWRLCIDTSEVGELSDGIIIDEYSVTHQYAFLTPADLLAVSFNVYNDGNLLEIVSMCSPHGTHVASIASANFPDEPEKNGVAPGAQIVSFTIGDNRISCMETGTALVRAMIHVMKRHGDKPVHVINMSYGEHAHWSNSGRIGDLMVEIVDKYQTTFVASAGNHGPALCTIGSPPDITADCLIGVGAYVSPDMMAAEYSMIEKLPGMPYTWSSRGPTIDGGAGVSVCAPGGAITSVPYFTLRNSQLMNGTSMAAPHVTGVVALLISGMMQKEFKFSPYSIKRALENSALVLSGVDSFSQGKGLVQVEKAFDHLCNYHEEVERTVRFHVQCGSQNGKGIHLRRGVLDSPKEWTVNVEPIFNDKEDYNGMVAFNMNLNLVCSAPWVDIPSHLAMSNISRSMNVQMDPRGLKEGVHSTCIRAYDANCASKGPVFNIPVTAVCPTILQGDTPEFRQRDVLFESNTIKRHFIVVPDRSSWVVFKLRCREKIKWGKFIVHAVQLFPKKFCKSMEFHKLFPLTANSEIVQSFPCRGGVILEVAIAKYWSSLAPITVDYDIEFRGVIPNYPSINMVGADGIFTVNIVSGDNNEEIAPSVSLKSSVLVCRPSESKITACCKERDVIPPSRQIYENILTYNFHISKTSEVTPICPLLSDMLYESEFESQLWMLYDNNKQLLMIGDAYPAKYSVKLEKGDHVLKLDVRHEKKELLEKLSDMPMLISHKLCQPISLDIFVNFNQAVIQGKKMIAASIPRGRYSLPIYISPLVQDNNNKVMKNVPIGQYLQGTISYAKDEIGKKVDIYPFRYVLPETVKKVKGEKEKDKQKPEEVDESIRDFYISLLTKLEPGEKANEVYESLKSLHPNNLQVLLARLTCLDIVDVKSFGVLPFFKTEGIENSVLDDLRESCQSVIEISDEILSILDSTTLLSTLAIKTDARPEATKAKQAAEKQKTAYLEALARKGCAIARLQALNVAGGEPATDLEKLNEIWREIVKFVDGNDPKVLNFMLWHAVSLKQYSRAVRFYSKMAEDKPSSQLDQKIIEICRIMNWGHVVHYLEDQMIKRYPAKYRNF